MKGLLRLNDPIALLKTELLLHGMRVTTRAVERAGKREIRTRSGVSGGVDIILPGDVHVNVTTTETFSRASPYELVQDDQGFHVQRCGIVLAPAELVPSPAWYTRSTSDGTPMTEVAQQCSADRLCIGMTRHCSFWRRDLRCKYCSIGANVSREARDKTTAQILEVVEAAIQDPVLPARHILIGGGTPAGDDHGTHRAAEICAALRRRWDLSVYVMVVPPDALSDIDRLRDAGADELGMNIEFFDGEALSRFAPGKAARVGHTRYFLALEHAVRLFGASNTRSIAITGLEAPEATVRGAARLAEMGVMPILSPFRPLDGSDLADLPAPSAAQQLALHDAVVSVCAPHGIVPGPTCIACQNNTLAFPSGAPYRHY